MKRALVAVAVLAAATPAAAQNLTGGAGATVGTLRSRTRVGGSTEAFVGPVIGGEGRVGLGRVSVDLSYLQGTLEPDTGSAEPNDYVEGDAYLSVVTVPGVTLRVGPRAHAYISSTGTQRWLFWTGRVRGERSLIAPGVSGFIEVWAAFSADVNVSEEFSRGTGGTAGMTVHLGKVPFYGRLMYSVEHASMGDGTRLDTVESVSLVVGYGRR